MLGLPVKAEDGTQGYCVFSAGSSELVVEAVAEDAPEEDKALVGRFTGLSFTVQDAEAKHRELAERGVLFTGLPEKQPWGGILATLQDPSGNEIQIVQHPDAPLTPASTGPAIVGNSISSAPDSRPANAVEKPSRGWLQDLSNASQVVGAIAVVASLVYVGIQLRQNTRQLQREENNATQAQWQTIRLTLAGNREVAQLWVAGLDGEALNAVQRLRFESLLSEHTWATFHIWDRAQAGIFEPKQFERGAAPPLARWLSTKGGARWWARTKVQYAPGFVRDMDAAIARLTPQ